MNFYIYSIIEGGRIALLTPTPMVDAQEAMNFAGWYSRTYNCAVRIEDHRLYL